MPAGEQPVGMGPVGMEPRDPAFDDAAPIRSAGSAAQPDPEAPVERPGSYAAAWFGVIGLIAVVFVPWGGIASVVALISAAVARSPDAELRRARLVGVVTGVAGLVLCAVWMLVALALLPELEG